MSNIQAGPTIPVMAILGAVLVILKLLGKISISWIWVLAPFWLPLAVTLVVGAVIFVGAVIAAVLSEIF